MGAMQRAAEANRIGSIRQRRIRPDEHLVVAWIHPGEVAGQFSDSVNQLLYTELREGGLLSRGGAFLNLQSGPRIAEARSQIVEAFLSHDVYAESEWLLMVDADMVFTPADVRRLVGFAEAQLRPVVGGLCFAGYSPETMHPTIYRLLPQDDTWAVEKVYDYEPDAMLKVGATGAAFLLVHRSLLVKMYERFGRLPNGQVNCYPWFVEGHVDHQGRQIGEDVAFCIRANSMGVPVYVHTGIKIGHRKSIVLTEALYDDMRLLRDVKVELEVPA